MNLFSARPRKPISISRSKRVYFRSILATAGLGLGLFGGAPSAEAQTWTQPTSGTSSNWSTGNWSPGIPTSGTTTALTFDTYYTSSAYAFNNDNSGFIVNQINLNAWSSNLLTLGGTTNTLTFDGTAPQLVNNGPGAVTINSALTLNQTTAIAGSGNGTLTLSGVIGGTGGLTINQSGLGIVALTSANSFSGGATLSGGTLSLGNATALGSNTLTVNGGAITFSSALTIANPIVVNGTLSVLGTVTGTLTGSIAGSGGLTLLNYNTTTGLTLQAADSYSGPTTLVPFIPSAPSVTSGPTLTLSGAGTLTNTSGITIGRGALLQLTNATATDISARVPAGAPISVLDGKIAYTALAADNTTLGSITATGVLGLTATPTGSPTLNFGTLTRVDNATIVTNGSTTLNTIGTTGPGATGLIGSSTTGLKVFFSGGLPTIAVGTGTGTQIGIVPFVATGSYTNPSGAATYDSTNGLSYIAISNSNYYSQISGSTGVGGTAGSNLLAATNQNVAIGGAAGTTILVYDLGGNSVTVNALGATTPNGGSTIQNGTIKVASGSVINYNQITWSNVTLDFGTATGYLESSYYQVFTGTSQITGSAGLVVYGLGGGTSGSATNTHTTTFQNTSGNPFTNGLFINGSTYLGFNQDNQLGAAGGSITLAGGSLAYNGSANLTISRPITIDAANGGLTFNLTSAYATAGAATATTTVTLSGPITGAGAFIKEGLGTVALGGSNSYSGGNVITAGTLQFTTDSNLGFGGTTITLNGGTLQPLASVSTNRPINVNAASTILTNVPLALTGSISTIGQLYGTANPTLTKTGTGILTLQGSNAQLSGVLAVSAGGVTVSGASGTLGQVANITVASGAQLVLDNSAGYNGNRIGDFSILSLAGGYAGYIGGSTASNAVAEQYGSLTVTAANSVFSVTAGTANPTAVHLASLSITSGSLTLRGDNLGAASGNRAEIFIDGYTTNLQVISGVYFANTSGTGTSSTPAGYSTTLGVVQFTPVPTSGTTIDNITATNPTSVGAAYTTTGSTAANTGASIYSLTLNGGAGASTLTLNATYAAQSGNTNTTIGTLNISGGLLTSQNVAQSVVVGSGFSTTTPTIDFGGAAATITTTTDLTLAAVIALTGTNGLTKAGAGTLTVNGTYGITGPLAITAGTLVLPNGGTVTALSGTGALSVGAATLTVAPTTASTFAGSFSDTASTALVVKGTAAFTFAPTNTPLLGGGTTVANGTLVLGSAGAAAAVPANLTLGSATGNTSGILDLGGFSPSAAVTAITIAGTGTAHQIINSSATASTLNLNFASNTSLPLSFGGNLIVNKNDANTLTLTGTAQPTSSTGVINVNSGTLQLTGGAGTVASPSQGLGTGMSVTVASGATFQLAAASGATSNTLGTITLNGGTFSNAGASYFDVFLGSLAFTNGGTVSLNSSGTTYYEFQTAGGGITSSASSTPALITATAGSLTRIYNNTGSAFPVSVAAGTVPSGIDLDSQFIFNYGTQSLVKTGAGVFQLSSQGNSYAIAINAGTVQLNGASPTVATASGAITVNSTGTLRGDNAAFNNATVNSGGTILGGSIANPGGTLTSLGNVTVGSGGTVSTFFSRTGAGTANASLLNLTSATGVLNLAPGTGNTFGISLTSDAANPFVQGETYTINLATVAAAGNIQLNGVALSPSTVVPTSNYTVSAANFSSVGSGYTLSTDSTGTILELTFSPVPEPASLLLIGGAALLGVRRVRRRR